MNFNEFSGSKRAGRYADRMGTLGEQTFDFRMKAAFPRKLSREFLLVDLVNNVDQLGEEAADVLQRIRERLPASDVTRLKTAVRSYGSEKAKKFFMRALAEINSVAA
jgi:hypothetical protein